MALQLINRSSEVRLTQTLMDMRPRAAGWQAVVFHLSELLEEYKSEYQIRIAINLIHDLLKNYDGGIYLMSDYNIIVLCHKLDPAILDKLIFQLRYLYMDDPLAYTDVGQENPQFCLVYELKHEWQALYDVALQQMNKARKPGSPEREQPQREQPQRAQPQKMPVLENKEKKEPFVEPVTLQESARSPDRNEMSALKLVAIERNLRTTDLNAVVRRQPVCAVLSGMKVRRVFDELYINIQHLRRNMKSEVDFLSNRWLFKYMTHILDERMLNLIRNNTAQFLNSPISININVETLLSSWFTEFDSAIPNDSKVSVVLEVPVVDIFADMTAFQLARDEVQKRGYRVCLDGLTAASLTSISRERLGLDLVKVQWNADQHYDLASKENQTLKESIETTGNNRVILCRCDNKSAVEYGQALGISLFQGRFLDNILNPTSKVEN